MRTQVATGFSMALAAIDEAVIVIGSEPRTVIACNAAAERMFGYSASEMCGRDTSFLHVDPSSFHEFGRRSEEELGRFGEFRGSFRMRRKDGSIFDTLHTVVLLDRGKGIPGGAASIIRDASEVESLKRRLEEAERRFVESQKLEVADRLAAALAHDLKNHLTVITGNTEFLIESGLSPEQREFAEDIRFSTSGAVAVSRRLMSSMKSQDSIAADPVDLNSSLRSAERIIRAAAGRSTIVSMELSDSFLPVALDDSAVEQLLVNLVINASDAMPEGGKLTIRTEVLGPGDPRLRELGADRRPHAILSVTDTGKGMDDEVRARLFEPFFTTKGERGTGLGLVAVDALVSRAGGRIQVASEPGGGTAFRILLPEAGLARDDA